MSSFAIHGTTRRRTNPIFPVVKFSQTSYKVKPATKMAAAKSRGSCENLKKLKFYDIIKGWAYRSAQKF
jgi:hypothetical protein